MGIELRMWYYDTLDCTNIYICYPIGVLGQEKSDAGQPDPPNKPEAKYPSGVAGFSLFIYITSLFLKNGQALGREIFVGSQSNRPFSARDMKLRMGLDCGVYLTLFCLNPACQLRRTT